MSFVPKLSDLARHWRFMLVRGLLFVVIALPALVLPLETLTGVIAVVGAAAALAGVTDIVYAIRLRRRSGGWWLVALQGLVGLALAGVLLAFPFVPASVLGLTLALWAGLHAFALLVLLGELRPDLPLRRLSAVWTTLALAVAFAAALYWTEFTFLAFLYAVAAFAFAWGLLEVVAALRLRTLRQRETAA